MRTLLIALTAALLLIACADELPGAPSQPPRADLSEIEQAAAKLREWLDTAPSVQLEISAVADSGPLRWQRRDITELTATAMITDNQFYLSIRRPARDLPDQPWGRTETLIVGEREYSRWNDAEGWLATPLADAQRNAPMVILPDQIIATSWFDLSNVRLTLSREGGRPVWLVEYEVDRELLEQQPDLLPPIVARVWDELYSTTQFTIPISTSVRLWIERDTGAPLRTETFQRLDDDGFREVELSAAIELASWGSLLKLPTPEPLFENYFYVALAALPPVVRYRVNDSTATQTLRRAIDEWFTDDSEETVVQDSSITLNDELQMFSGETTIHAETDELPLALESLYPFFGVVRQSLTRPLINEYDRFETVLELRLSAEALAALQDLVVSAVQMQLDNLIDSPLVVLSVERLDVEVWMLSATGALFGGQLSADATTADGPLELEIDLRVTSIDRDDLN